MTDQEDRKVTKTTIVAAESKTAASDPGRKQSLAAARFRATEDIGLSHLDRKMTARWRLRVANHHPNKN